MAEQDNVTLIRNIYKAFGEGDIQTILANVDANAEWINYGPSSIPYAGTFSGRMSDFFKAIDASTTGGKVTPETFVAQGDTVVSTGRYSAVVRSNGAKIDTPVAHVFTVRNGKVTKWNGYSDSALVAAAHTKGAAAAG